MTRGPLDVWIYGVKAAILSETPTGLIELTWTTDARVAWGLGPSVVSHLLPIERAAGPHPRRVQAFLDGLLPEGNARVNYAMDVGLASQDTFGMIARYGRDTAGALVFQPEGEHEPIRVGSYVPITEAEVGARLREADRHSPTDPEARGVESISLAGMQPKIGVHRIGDGWLACRGGAPSTWIIKLGHPPGSGAADVIDTEVLSLDLARAIGLTTVRAEVHDFDGVRAIAVPRYDRVEADGELRRIHQEDLAQALGLNTNDPNRKFQRGNALPSLRAAADVLRSGGAEPDELLRLVAFNLLIGNTDAHAKNISFLRLADGGVRLAPAYDVAMHMHHANVEALSAIDINGRYRLAQISAADVVEEGIGWGIAPKVSRRLVADTARQMESALAQLDETDYPGVSGRAFDTVRARIRGGLGDRELPDAGLHQPEPRVWVPAHIRNGRDVAGHFRQRGPRAR